MPHPPPPPWHFLYLRETHKSWRCEGEGEEKVHLKTHITERGIGKNMMEWNIMDLTECPD